MNRRANDSRSKPPALEELYHRQEKHVIDLNKKSYYIRLIREVFEDVEHDSSFRKKTLFDMIDYCELLFEELSLAMKTELGLRTYVKGYLILNCFISNFVMVHFGGFDEFIRLSKLDFMIYLHLFLFYNGKDKNRGKSMVKSKEVECVRECAIEYLDQKHLLKFNITELHNWLNEYIAYIYDHESSDGVASEERTANNEDNSSVENGRQYADDYLHGGNHKNSNISSHNEPRIKSRNGHSGSEVESNFGSSVRNEEIGLYPHQDYESDSSKESIEFQPTRRVAQESDKRYYGSDRSYRKSETARLPHYPVKHSGPPMKALPNTPSIASKSQPDLSLGIHYHQNNGKITPLKHVLSSNYVDSGPTAQHKKDMPKATQNVPKKPTFAQNVSSASHLQTSERDKTIAPYPLGNSDMSLNRSLVSSRTEPPADFSAVPSYSSNNNLKNFPIQPVIQPYANYPFVSNNRPSSMPPKNLMPEPVALGSNNNNTYMRESPNSRAIQHAQNSQRQKTELMKAYAICGLKNLGSSCYINLTIQVLFGLTSFKSIFTHAKYIKYISDPKYISSLKHSGTDTDLLSEAIASLLKSFEQHGGASISPTKFLRVASKLKPDFCIPYEQQDAQEFLLFVLERLHEELSYKFCLQGDADKEKLDNYVARHNVRANMKDKQRYLDWYKSLIKSEGLSPINDLFEGHLQNKLICQKCGYESITYAQFSILSLPIPYNFSGKVDLAECLSYYKQDEVLYGENAWQCPRCHKEQRTESELDSHPVFENKRNGLFHLGRRHKSAEKEKERSRIDKIKNDSQGKSISIKTLNFIKLPKVLLIHLSRFSVFDLTQKLDTIIKYPLQLKFNNSSNKNEEITYKLVGLINHYGSLKSGHYTSLINKSIPSANLDDMKYPYWCYFDDDSLKINLRHGSFEEPYIDFQELNSRDVYVLSYEKLPE